MPLCLEDRFVMIVSIATGGAVSAGSDVLCSACPEQWTTLSVQCPEEGEAGGEEEEGGRVGEGREGILELSSTEE